MKVLITNLVKAYFREKNFLFWDWMFPIILMTGVAIFARGEGYATFFLPGLVSFLIFQGLIYSIPFRMAQLREDGVLRLIAEEGSLKLFGGAFLIARVIIAGLQVCVFLPIAVLILQPVMTVNVLWLCIAFVTVLFGLGGFSLMVASVAKTVNSALGLAQLSYIGLTALSGIFFPIDKSPYVMQLVAKVSPITYSRMLFDYSLSGVGSQPLPGTAFLMLFGAAATVIAFAAGKKLSLDPVNSSKHDWKGKSSPLQSDGGQ